MPTTNRGLTYYDKLKAHETKFITSEIEDSGGTITIDSIATGGDSTVAIQNSDSTYKANLTVDGDVTAGTSLTVTAGGATVTAGGLTVTAGGATITAGGLTVTAGRINEGMTPVDVDAQNYTLLAASILSGIVVHTSTAGGGTVTMDTGTNIVDGCVLASDGDCITCYYVNDGDQTLTFAAGLGGTVADTGCTIGTNCAATLVFRRTGAAAVTLYIIGSVAA